jgi:hypothetical protein
MLVAACAGELDEKKFETCEAPAAEALLVAKCGSCHDAASPDGNLDLASPDPASRLVEVMSTQGPCAGRPLIGHDGSRLLLDRIPVSDCGMAMPVAMSADESKCLADWANSLVGAE